MSKFVTLTNDGVKDNLLVELKEFAQYVRHLQNGLPDAFGDGEFHGFLLTLGEQAAETAFDIPIDNLTSVVPLLYQSGYITIKDYDKQGQIYTLGIPNDEVRIGLMQSLMPNYIRTIGSADTVIRQYYMAMKDHDIDSALTLLQTFFKTVPYCNDIDHEGHWQQMLYVIFSLLGARCDVEVHTSHGRVDLVAAIWGKLYLMEVKLDQSAETALSQINLKEYDSRFALYNLPIVKLGVNFSTKERTITDWEVEK